ncbi:MAG: DNA repair protein RecO [Litoreibacter sp.]|nr:DNA repair protein RecO [Litoreibacter sp.]
MEWRGEGVLLAVRRHGESAAIIEVFTREYGRHAGVVRGGASRKIAPILQPGAQLDVTWRARLEDHLGSFSVEPLKSRAAQVMGDRKALAGLNAICGLLSFSMAERDPHPELYVRSIDLFDRLGVEEDWPLVYLKWELALLEDLGFGLDLVSCAVTGTRDDLAYVSPRSGRAVSREGAGEWAGKLLPLPLCLMGQGPTDPEGLADGLKLTGYFLNTWLAPELGDKPLPAARQRLVDILTRKAD